MIIRNATNKDAEQVLELAKKFATSFKTDKEKFYKIYPEIVGDRNISFVVAEENNQIIGYCLSFHHLTFYANGYVSWVEEIMVNENYRSKGVGKKMMEEIEQISKSMDSKLIGLATRRAANFYEKIGYEESATYFRKLL
jgi:N-acetylglutamate synthase-like GNAT family acetyltransferase